MANVLTDLAADIYKSADIVGREIVGGVSSVMINANGTERVALNDTVRSHFTRQPTASSSITEAMTIPEGTDQTVDTKTITISKAQSIQIPWTGEDMRHVNNGSGFSTVYGDQITQAMRTLTNEIENDVMSALYQGGSRAFGTAGTTPFASDFKSVAELRQILVDNGQSPARDTSLILNTSAGTKLRNLANLQSVDASGSSELLRNGTLLDLQGIFIKESAGVQSHTKGTGSSYLVNSAAMAIGDTVIPVDTGAGTILVGDIVVFAGDTSKHVVTVALSGGSFTIGGNGLQSAIADNAAITVGASFTGNVCVKQGAAELVMRPPAVPEGGDAATDAMVIQDPFSGLVFELRAYKGYRKSMFEVAAAWGQKVWKNDGIAVLLG